MATIQLYMIGVSPPCRSVYMTAKALGVKVEEKIVDVFKKENLTPEFLKINPRHKIPAITDGDFVLTESRAIMKYLVGKYGGEDNSLYPRDLHKRALIDSLLDHDLAVFYRSMLEDIILPTMRKIEISPEQEKKVVKAFEWLESEIKGKKFIAGDDMTIADFSLVVGFQAIELKDCKDKYPETVSWYQRMGALPYYTEVNKPFIDFAKKLKGNAK